MKRLTFAITTVLLSTLSCTSMAGEIPSQPPVSDTPIRLAHVHAIVSQSSVTGRTYTPSHQVCDLRADIPVYDMIRKTGGSQDLQNLPKCSVLIHGVSKNLLLTSLVSLVNDMDAQPSKSVEMSVMLDDKILSSSSASTGDLRDLKLGMGFSFETFDDPATNTQEFLLVNVLVEDSNQ